jgi:hypothetical protein
MVVGGWFVVREKYCWLVADKPSEQGLNSRRGVTGPLLIAFSRLNHNTCSKQPSTRSSRKSRPVVRETSGSCDAMIENCTVEDSFLTRNPKI